jgi:hypothetical protein
MVTGRWMGYIHFDLQPHANFRLIKSIFGFILIALTSGTTTGPVLSAKESKFE